MLAYRVELTPDDNETLLVLCPSLPMVATFGETRDAALLHARDAIETALASMIADGEDVPPADPDGTLVRLPMLTTLKVALYQALREVGITRAELARRLGWKRNRWTASSGSTMPRGWSRSRPPWLPSARPSRSRCRKQLSQRMSRSR